MIGGVLLLLALGMPCKSAGRAPKILIKLFLLAESEVKRKGRLLPVPVERGGPRALVELQ